MRATIRAVSGTRTLRCGRARMRAIGSAGSTSPGIKPATSMLPGNSRGSSVPKTLPMRCCWAWADRVSVLRYWRKVSGSAPHYPKLHVLDSTDPQQVRRFESSIDIARTLFIVSSKSGTTLETSVLMDYFFAKASSALGAAAGPALRRHYRSRKPIAENGRRKGLPLSVLRAFPALAGVIRCCRISAWCRWRRAVTTCKRFSTRRASWRELAGPTCRPRKIRPSRSA